MDSLMEKELEKLLETADRLLEGGLGCHTNADKKALADMADKARAALEGEEAPFSRNREFMRPGREEALRFAYDRFTMVPTFFKEGKVYNHYGLKEAVAWYREQDMSLWTKEQLLCRKEEVLARGKELLRSASYGEGIGQYSPKMGEELRRQVERVTDAKETELPEALAHCIDAIWDFRFSAKLRSEADTDFLFLLSPEKAEEIKETIRKESLVKRQYEKIKQIAGSMSLADTLMSYEQIWEKHTYEELNQHFSIWGDTGRVVNFMTPEGTVGARLSVCLPKEENEEQGLGHVWITDLHLYSASGPEAEIPNARFAEKANEPSEDACPADGWRMDSSVGHPQCRREELKSIGSCLYLCNPSPADQAAAVCGNSIPLQENSGYTLYFKAKQDGKLKEGFRTVLEFVDRQGKDLGQFTYVYNRKSMPREGRSALNMQCNAIVYALEGDTECALKAKYEMFAFLNDFCQGAEYWLTYNARPEGCDAYGAVQSGRIMCSVASTYSLIRSGAAFTEQEKKKFYGMVDYLLRYCLDMRDRMTMSAERAQRGSSNWQTDMCIGVASLMMVLPDYPDRKVWLYNAEAVLRAQLSVNLNGDGSWPESIRYHFAALEHFATFAAAWKQEMGEDWLLTTRLKEMFGYCLHTVTPPYEYFEDRIGTPPFGDHKLSGGTEFGIYGLYVERIAKTDRKLADELYQAWKLAGSPVKGLSGEGLAIENLLYAEPAEYCFLEENRLNLFSAVNYPDSGIYVFRQGFLNSEQKQNRGENYLAVMAAEKPVGHGHLDQGSFILYHQNVPVVMDSGIEGYFEASTQWHLSSYSHACLQFAVTPEEQSRYRRKESGINLTAGNYSLDRGWWDVPRICRVLNTEAGEETECICMEIAHPLGKEKGVHQRTIQFYKDSGEVVIRDRIENYQGKVLFSLPLAMRSAEVEGNTVHGAGYYSVHADVEFFTPPEELLIEQGRTTPMFPDSGDVPMLLYVRAKFNASQEIQVRIRPRKDTTKASVE